MLDPVMHRQGGIFEKLVVETADNPPLFDLLCGCMSIQPEIDANAGSGAAFPIEVFLELGLNNEQHRALLKKVGNSAPHLYVFLRASNHSFWRRTEEADELVAYLESDAKFDLTELLTHIRVIDEKFGYAFFEGNNGDKKKGRSKRASNSKPRRSDKVRAKGRGRKPKA